MGVELQLYSFLDLAIDGSLVVNFTHRIHYPWDKSLHLVGPTVCLEAFEVRKISFPCRK